MSERVRVTVSVQLPQMPNFLRTEDDTPFDVADITDDGLREIGARWTEALVEHAQKRRAAKVEP